MSAKYFCDVCEEEMSEDDHGRIIRRLGDVEIEVMHAFKGCWNKGHVCHACLSNVFRNGTPPNREEHTQPLSSAQASGATE